MGYVPLHVHSTFSLLDGLSQPWQIAMRARQIGAPAVAITDHGSLAGVPSFLRATQNVCKHCGYQPNHHGDGRGVCMVRGVSCPGYEALPLKPIAGIEFYLCRQSPRVHDGSNRSLSHLVVLAKNRDGWRQLMRASTASNHPDNYYYKPRLDLDTLASFANGNLVAFSGHPGSDMADVCFTNPRAAYASRTEEEARSYLKPWKELRPDMTALAGKYREIFGKDNFWLEVQLIDAANLPAAGVVAKAMRWLAAHEGYRCVATPDAHYPSMDDARDQRVLLCAATHNTLAGAERRLAANEDFTLGGFFRSNRYHIPTLQELLDAGHLPGELQATHDIAAACEDYSIFGKPRLPNFPCPDGKNPDVYLRELCEAGWTRKCGSFPAGKVAEYRQRLEYELGVLAPVGLSPYFLIVHDLCQYAHKNLGCKKPRGRGSAAGCLISYLLDICDCDPIKYGLSFERFYNAGRNDPAKGKISLPDIDMDFPTYAREPLIAYTRKKYGEDRVAQIATFGRMKGRSALTDVLSAHEWGTHEERKAITSLIPDEAAISDQLQEMLELTGESSTIRWALEYRSEKFTDYCVQNDDGSLDGPMARFFEQAIRLENTRRSMGKHAAGVIISPTPLADECPMLYDKSSGLLYAGFEYPDLEAMGVLKLDYLSVRSYNKVETACRMARFGDTSDECDNYASDYDYEWEDENG